MEEKITIEKENVMNFYEELGSSHYKMQTHTLEKFGNAKLDIYFKSEIGRDLFNCLLEY